MLAGHSSTARNTSLLSTWDKEVAKLRMGRNRERGRGEDAGTRGSRVFSRIDAIGEDSWEGVARDGLG